MLYWASMLICSMANLEGHSPSSVQNKTPCVSLMGTGAVGRNEYVGHCASFSSEEDDARKTIQESYSDQEFTKRI